LGGGTDAEVFGMSGSGDGLIWRRSRKCGNSACVEVGADTQSVHVRDSKDPCGGRLTFSHAQWRHFVATIRSGCLDVPARGTNERSAL
jgi:hypothetical protein